MRFEVGSIVVGSGTAVVPWRWSGLRVWSDLEAYSIEGVPVLRVADGLIVHQVVYYDPSPLRTVRPRSQVARP